MTKGYDVKKSRSEIKEIQQNVEEKKGELSKLEEQKQALLEAITDVEGANVDEQTKQIVHESISTALEANKEKGNEMSTEMGDDIKHLEDIRQEINEYTEGARNQKESLKGKQKMLERFGIGGALEKGISNLDSNISELNTANQEAINVMQELSKVSQQLGGL